MTNPTIADLQSLKRCLPAIVEHCRLSHHTAPHDRTPGDAIDRVTDAIRALRQGDLVAGDAVSDCCGKWVVLDSRDVATAACGCAHPANDVAAIDAFLDDHDALFGRGFAA